jgi:hypothetical protein
MTKNYHKICRLATMMRHFCRLEGDRPEMNNPVNWKGFSVIPAGRTEK